MGERTLGNKPARHYVKATPFRITNCHGVLCELVQGHGGPRQFELPKDVCAETYLLVLPNIINHYWECHNVLEKEVEILKIDPMVSIITG